MTQSFFDKQPEQLKSTPVTKITSSRNTYTLSIFLILSITPVFYLIFLKVFLREYFADETSIVMFLLYNMPFWFLLMFIIGVELFRRSVTRKFAGITPIYMVMIGSLIIALTGIIISPVGPGLFSRGAVVFMATNLVLGTISGLIIDRLFRRACGLGGDASETSG